MSKKHYKVVVIGASAGALHALDRILPKLPAKFPIPVVVVCHRLAISDSYLSDHFAATCAMDVKEIDNFEPLNPHTIYFAPADFHVLIADNHEFNLTADPHVNYSRPSIDVTFESIAEVYESAAIGVVLTGANSDGANGLKAIKNAGGYAIVQDPATAEAAAMPQSAINSVEVDKIVTLEEMPELLCELCRINSSNT